MANHVYFNDQTQYGRMLRQLLRELEHSDELFTDVRDVMIQMRENDGSQDSDYATVTTRFGFDSNAKARAAFEELDSAYSKTSGDLFAKLRG